MHFYRYRMSILAWKGFQTAILAQKSQMEGSMFENLPPRFLHCKLFLGQDLPVPRKSHQYRQIC